MSAEDDLEDRKLTKRRSAPRTVGRERPDFGTQVRAFQRDIVSLFDFISSLHLQTPVKYFIPIICSCSANENELCAGTECSATSIHCESTGRSLKGGHRSPMQANLLHNDVGKTHPTDVIHCRTESTCIPREPPNAWTLRTTQWGAGQSET